MIARPRVPRVKICGMTLLEDVIAAATAGADSVGFLVGLDYESEDGLQPTAAANLVRRTPADILTVLVTHASTPDRIRTLVDEVRPRVVQVHGSFASSDLPQLMNEFPDVSWIRAIHSEDDGSLDEALRAAHLFDAILLDTRSGKRIGGTGKTHDWQISRKIREALDKPVILAGGLTPDNVVEAIRTVRPHGVDVNTGISERRGVKSAPRVAAFVLKALGALTIDD